MDRGEIEATIRGKVKESGDLRRTGICCINIDHQVDDANITAIFDTVRALREELGTGGEGR